MIYQLEISCIFSLYFYVVWLPIKVYYRFVITYVSYGAQIQTFISHLQSKKRITEKFSGLVLNIWYYYTLL